MITEEENTSTTILTSFEHNGMVASPAKLRMMFLERQVDTMLHLNVNGKIIPEAEKVKLLGITNDSNLNFDSHIKEICGKVNQKTSTLFGLRGYIGEKKANYY